MLQWFKDRYGPNRKFHQVPHPSDTHRCPCNIFTSFLLKLQDSFIVVVFSQWDWMLRDHILLKGDLWLHSSWYSFSWLHFLQMHFEMPFKFSILPPHFESFSYHQLWTPSFYKLSTLVGVSVCWVFDTTQSQAVWVIGTLYSQK